MVTSWLRPEWGGDFLQGFKVAEVVEIITDANEAFLNINAITTARIDFVKQVLLVWDSDRLGPGMSISRTDRDSKLWIIPLTIAISLLLTVIPYPGWMQYAVPQWTTLVIFLLVSGDTKSDWGWHWLAGGAADGLVSSYAIRS